MWTKNIQVSGIIKMSVVLNSYSKLWSHLLKLFGNQDLTDVSFFSIPEYMIKQDIYSIQYSVLLSWVLFYFVN